MITAPQVRSSAASNRDRSDLQRAYEDGLVQTLLEGERHKVDICVRRMSLNAVDSGPHCRSSRSPSRNSANPN